MAGRTGLRYEGVMAVLTVHADHLGLPDLSDALGQVQVIERAILEVDAERAEADRADRDLKQMTGGLINGVKP